jgi:[ribosomal protein S5]-alanine N-acetyltransferase
MTEAARAVLELGFVQVGQHRIYATCRPENISSQRVLEKIGMTREGHLRQDKWMKGQWRDSFLYAMLVDEWGNNLP